LPIVLHQFKSPLIYILLAAMAISLAIAHWEDALVIGVVLVLNTVIGLVQEYRAENAIVALMRMVSTRATVLRDGQRTELESVEIVPGDVVLLESGDIVPADLRLVEATRLECDEAMLTGESVPVGKIAEPIAHDGPLPAAECRNMAFSGSAVTSGRGRGFVVATGARTQVPGRRWRLSRDRRCISLFWPVLSATRRISGGDPRTGMVTWGVAIPPKWPCSSSQPRPASTAKHCSSATHRSTTCLSSPRGSLPQRCTENETRAVPSCS
jgi:hypothetical protein